jgi:hypothetical protein
VILARAIGDLWHRVEMRVCTLGLLLTAALTSSACFQMTTVLKVNGDGSGTIEHRMLYTTAALTQLRNFAALGGKRGPGDDPLSEQQARDLVTSIGPGVTYVSSTPVQSPIGQGRDAVYAFTDVSQLRISTQPAAPGGISVKAGGMSSQGETITFSIARQADGNATLRINVPEPNFVEALGSPAAANQLAMVKTLLAGAKVLLAVEPNGPVVRTSSPWVEGQRVTLLEVDLDKVLGDETLVPRLQAAKTPDEAKGIIKTAPGLKINLDREITVEFTPAK